MAGTSGAADPTFLWVIIAEKTELCRWCRLARESVARYAEHRRRNTSRFQNSQILCLQYTSNDQASKAYLELGLSTCTRKTAEAATVDGKGVVPFDASDVVL